VKDVAQSCFQMPPLFRTPWSRTGPAASLGRGQPPYRRPRIKGINAVRSATQAAPAVSAAPWSESDLLLN
jgi:hypothetical protein